MATFNGTVNQIENNALKVNEIKKENAEGTYPTTEAVKKFVEPIMNDYIVESGVTDIWTWEKWSSGKAVCWGTKFWELSRTGNFWWGDISLPFTFYKAANTINDFCITLSGGTNHTGALYTDSTALYSTSTVTVINTASDYVEEAHDVVVHYHIIGKWK